MLESTKLVGGFPNPERTTPKVDSGNYQNCERVFGMQRFKGKRAIKRGNVWWSLVPPVWLLHIDHVTAAGCLEPYLADDWLIEKDYS